MLNCQVRSSKVPYWLPQQSSAATWQRWLPATLLGAGEPVTFARNHWMDKYSSTDRRYDLQLKHGKLNRSTTCYERLMILSSLGRAWPHGCTLWWARPVRAKQTTEVINGDHGTAVVMPVTCGCAWPIPRNSGFRFLEISQVKPCQVKDKVRDCISMLSDFVLGLPFKI